MPFTWLAISMERSGVPYLHLNRERGPYPGGYAVKACIFSLADYIAILSKTLSLHLRNAPLCKLRRGKSMSSK